MCIALGIRFIVKTLAYSSKIPENGNEFISKKLEYSNLYETSKTPFNNDQHGKTVLCKTGLN